MLAETEPRIRYTVHFKVLSWIKKRVNVSHRPWSTRRVAAHETLRRWSKVPQAEKRAPLPAARSPVPRTITVATSPSLVDRFHSSTLKCLKTLRNGCSHTGGIWRREDLTPGARPRAGLRTPPGGARDWVCAPSSGYSNHSMRTRLGANLASNCPWAYDAALLEPGRRFSVRLTLDPAPAPDPASRVPLRLPALDPAPRPPTRGLPRAMAPLLALPASAAARLTQGTQRARLATAAWQQRHFRLYGGWAT